MKITTYKQNPLSFKGTSHQIIFPEIPTRPDFVGNVALNAASELVLENKKLGFIPAGSWITNNNFDENLSDHDMTILLPNDKPYHQLEAEVADIRDEMTRIVKDKLNIHNISQKMVEEKILPSVNVFPAPQIQGTFSSYEQFRNLTNLKISLQDKIDPDKGLWQMKGVVASHFKNEGMILYKKEDGSVGHYRISSKPEDFYALIKEKGMYLPQESEIYTSDKLKIINEFVDKVEENKNVSIRSFNKYLQRIKKFIFIPSKDDLFLVSDDPRKNKLSKFADRISTEKEYQVQFNKIVQEFETIKRTDNVDVSDAFRYQTAKELTKFKQLAEEIMSWPSLRCFIGH